LRPHVFLDLIFASSAIVVSIVLFVASHFILSVISSGAPSFEVIALIAIGSKIVCPLACPTSSDTTGSILLEAVLPWLRDGILYGLWEVVGDSTTGFVGKGWIRLRVLEELRENRRHIVVDLLLVKGLVGHAEQLKAGR
jgi:hypothetical protein